MRKLLEKLYLVIMIWAVTLMFAACALTFGVRGEGACMLPTIPEKAYLIGVKKELITLEVGQIVLFKYDGERYYKRIAEINEHGIYALGDNPSNSYDSRYYGWIPYEDIIGIVINHS